MPDATVHNLLQAYFAGSADEKQVAALSDWIAASPDNAAYVHSMGWLELALTQHLKNESLDTISDHERAFLGRVDPEAWQLILDSVLSRRREFEALARVAESKPARGRREPAITVRELGSLACYLVAQGVRAKAGHLAAIAAALVIGAVLYFTLLDEPVAPDTPTTADATPANPRGLQDQAIGDAFATLTATQNATWGGAASPAPGQTPTPGDTLRAGQRLTLTAGFAQITTARGARVTLQGPCQIDLTDHDNTLRLQRGTLLASVPPAATGLTIDTPTARVVDIGTQFGVRVNADQTTELQVYKGEATLAPAVDDQIQPAQPATRVRAGQAAKAQHGKVALSQYRDADRFARADAFNRFGPALIAHYDMARPAGTTLRESSGEQVFDATIIGAQWAQGPRPGTHALSFTGKGWDERVVLSREASDRLGLQGDFTIALWVNLRELAPESGWSPILTKGNDAWRLLASRDKKTGEPRLGFYWSQGTEVPEMQYAGAVTGGRDIELNRWHHVIVTGQASETGQGAAIRLYLDGQLKAENTFPRTLTSDSPVALGAIQLDKGTQTFNGRLGGVTFLSRALTEDQARDLYHTGPEP